jgi:hypothetical protein
MYTMKYFGNPNQEHSANDDISRAIAKPLYAAFRTGKNVYTRGRKFLRGKKRGGKRTYKKKSDNGGCWKGGKQKRRSSKTLEKGGLPTCFPGNALVIMADGSQQAISAIRLGDRVQSCRGPAFPAATVMFVPHAPNEGVHMFHRLTTASGRALRATELHYLPVRPSYDRAKEEVVRCRDVCVGDWIETLQGGWEEVVRHEKDVSGVGVYSFLTEEEFIMVDGVRASPFGYDLFSHEVYHQLFHMLRWSYHWVPSWNEHPETVLAWEAWLDKTTSPYLRPAEVVSF